MSVDPIRAFEATAPEPSSTSGSTSDSAFPSVLESTLSSSQTDSSSSSSESGNRTASEDQNGAGEVGAESDSQDSQGTLDSSGEQSGDSDTSASSKDGQAESGDPAATAAAAGAIASRVVERLEERTGLGAEASAGGAPTDLSPGTGTEGAPLLSEAESDPALSAEVVRGIEAAIRSQEGVEEETLPASEAEGAGQGRPSVGAEEEAALAGTSAAVSREGVAEPQGAGTGSQALSEDGSQGDRGGAETGRDSQDQSERFSEAAALAQREEESVAAQARAEARPDETESGMRDLRPEISPAGLTASGATATAPLVGGEVAPAATPVAPVAGASPAPGAPAPAPAPDAIAVQTEWLLSRGGGTARLTLHPADLGEIAIRVTLRGDAVDVVMVAQEAAAQGIADEQSERLTQAFANRDLRMENFEVRRGDAGDLTFGEERFAESGDGSPEEGSGRDGGSEGGGADPRTPELDAMPRILTKAPETGVDLRI